MTQTWLLDFDDTLASGVVTWGLEFAVPKLVKANGLPFDQRQFAEASVVAIEQSNQTTDIQKVMEQFLETMDWTLSPRLQEQLLNDVQMGYQPELFADVLPFLERLRQNGDRLYIISNNPRAPLFCHQLALEDYFHDIYTPHLYPQSQPKPHRSLWDYLLAAYPEIDPERTVVVGDDPWSDGAFAEACNLPCWLVDRQRRFTTLYAQKAYRWVSSLAEIRA